ncbi:DUF3164 family protein [Candidatus Neomarinimicrobiota bacterium]
MKPWEARRIGLKVTVNDEGSWIDQRGRVVPPRYIEAGVKARDRLVRRIARKTARLHEQISVTKEEVLGQVDDYLALVAEEHGEAWKGNAELVTFDGRWKVEVKVSEALEFDERLQVAKQKIDGCLRRWTGNARAEVQAIVHHAFQVDSKGRINVRSILTLRQFRFKDEEWSAAMELIADSLRVRATRRYVNVYYRHNETGKFTLLPLNWSAV